MAGDKTCVICGLSKKPRECLKHKNKLLNNSLTICKDCANEFVDFKDEDSVITMCQLTNLPFIKRVMDGMVSDDTEQPTFGLYMRKIAPFKRYTTFLDSEFTQDGMEESIGTTFTVTDKMVQRWGDGYNDEKYAYFETALKGLMAIKPATTSLELERYVQDIKLKDVFNDSLRAGDAKAIAQLQKTYNDDLKQLGLDAVLNSKDDSVENVGQRIQKYEMRKPIPDRPEYDDAAGIMKYIQKWFIIPMKRTLGMASEEEVESLYEKDK